MFVLFILFMLYVYNMYFEYVLDFIRCLHICVNDNWVVSTPPAEKILFDTGCVGTDNEVCPDFHVSDRKCLDNSD